jgi:hypothetical protein
MGWLQKVPKRWHVSLVTKGVHVPNEGREAASFLWAMQKFYEDDGWIMFVQADPFDHCPDFLSILDDPRAPGPVFSWIGSQPCESDAIGGPWHGHPIPVREWYEQHVGPWRGKVVFAAGGQFLMPAWMIRARSQAELAQLYEQVCTDPDGPWVMERLWQELFVR